MNRPTLNRVLARGRTEPSVWAVLAALVVVEALVLAAYLSFTPAEATSLRYLVYPFVWIDVGLWAVLATYPATAGDDKHRLLAVLVAVVYFGVLASLSGLLAFYPSGEHAHDYLRGLQVTMSAPGWGPRVAYVAETFHVYFVPYRVAGYAALAYLVYAAALDAGRAAAGGLLGFAACIGCSFPALVPVVVAVTGGTLGLAATVPLFSMDVSTAAFVLTALALALRPV